jgi:3-oxoacyl-[acyl-carrier-protein] synthase-3
MPTFAFTGVRLAGIATAVPVTRTEVQPTPTVSVAQLAKIISSTGVKARHVAPAGVCASDLCLAAAERLLERLGWDRSSVELLIFVTQTPDYVLPATACSLHGRLGLAKSCAAFDVNLGCSGYVYGLSIAASHVQTGAARRALLLVGDTISKVISEDDRSVAFLFGDAGSATALESSAAVACMHFVTGSDGSGAGHLQIQAGMFREPSNEQTRVVRERHGGSVRSDEQLHMNGPEIFNFTIREVPAMIAAAMHAANWSAGQVDGFVLHQANRFMLEYVVKRMKLPSEKVVLSLEHYGNTSSASIPLAICDRLRERVAGAPSRLVLAGFGVGFSWAAAAVELDCPHVEPVILVATP